MVNRPHHHDPSQALVITGAFLALFPVWFKKKVIVEYLSGICVTDITVGLRRIPVGFHVSVHADGTEWRTANKPISVDASTIEWKDRITLYGHPRSGSLLLVLTPPLALCRALRMCISGSAPRSNSHPSWAMERRCVNSTFPWKSCWIGVRPRFVSVMDLNLRLLGPHIL